MRGKLANLWRTLFCDSVHAFGVVSIVLLVLLTIAPAKNYFSEWRHYQNAYLHSIAGRSDALTLRRHFKGDIQQIWLPDLGVVDRCETCHVGLKEATLTDVSIQPFTKHPAIPHKLDEFGCVMCHRGQGPATTVSEAHYSTLAWEEPVLPTKYIQSSCGQCHEGDLPGTPLLNEGRQLLAKSGCLHCHTVQVHGITQQPADAPPPLTHIADKTTREWIYAWIKDPQAYAVSAKMPNFELSEDDARDISAFLIADSTPMAGDTLSLKQTPSPDPVAGPSLYGESFCATCHAVQNAAGNVVGGNIGPELTRIGSKVKPEWLQGWLRNPRVYDPNTLMPHYRFTDQQLATMSGFLMGKTDSDLLANIHLDPATPQQIAHGKLLVMNYGCASCHEINGIKKPDNFAPDLSRIGSKSINQLLFLPGMPHTITSYIAGKIRTPRAFQTGLKMPQFSFTPEQVDALTTVLLSFNERAATLPPSLIIAGTTESKYEPAGKAGQLMRDLACFSCHRINGHGGDLAPDLSFEGSAVQKQWLESFLKNPGTLRPALIRRMPKFNLTDSEISQLSDYIMTVYQKPSIDRDSMPLSGYPAGQVEEGEQLFYSKYGCQACHIVNPNSDKGYIGPVLTAVGSRLNAAWIYAWLKDPQALRPGTMEPKRDMSDEDARALTAYLMSLKGSAKHEGRK
jgi:cytochrome c1